VNKFRYAPDEDDDDGAKRLMIESMLPLLALCGAAS